MNIIEAIKSGKPIKIKNWDCWLVFNDRGEPEFYNDDGLEVVGYDLTKDILLSDNWEIKEDDVLLVSDNFKMFNFGEIASDCYFVKDLKEWKELEKFIKRKHRGYVFYFFDDVVKDGFPVLVKFIEEESNCGADWLLAYSSNINNLKKEFLEIGYELKERD